MKSIVISSLVAALLSPAMVFAADGTINFTGSVVASTCTYGASGKSQTVALPRVSASALSAANTTAGDTAFDVQLENCGSTSKDVAIRLEGGAFDAATGNLKNTATTGAATNVMVQVADRNTNTAIRAPGNTAVVQSTTDGKATIPLLAKYVATGPATAGSVTSAVNFSIVYP
ncbi:fimbrial protein [Herbaspirillum sp. YR522]|uniref:fimbrial protein n=1 Tax=Herbaspirillum sp. YR522 TaxID=1144342 RepID=UPI00026F53AD|nr:fimbrial protein [Herbaspirillum sp. YR522]EJN05006.1 P pilus assembly protein, pilin FimA [Herbaspirillum sp. YR522]